jgi:hypothetical protein
VNRQRVVTSSIDRSHALVSPPGTLACASQVTVCGHDAYLHGHHCPGRPNQPPSVRIAATWSGRWSERGGGEAHATSDEKEPVGRSPHRSRCRCPGLAWALWPAVALASPLYPTGTSGYDVSWPNCSATAPHTRSFIGDLRVGRRQAPKKPRTMIQRLSAHRSKRDEPEHSPFHSVRVRSRRTRCTQEVGKRQTQYRPQRLD